jgi:hypothetical protein
MRSSSESEPAVPETRPGGAATGDSSRSRTRGGYASWPARTRKEKRDRTAAAAARRRVPARVRGAPAIAIGNLDLNGLAPRSHQPTDTTATIDQAALDRTVEFGVRLIAAVDDALGPDPRTSQPETTATPA